MPYNKVVYKNLPVFYKKSILFPKISKRRLKYENRETKCAICKKDLIEATSALTIISNCKLFPNCYVCLECGEIYPPKKMVKKIYNDWSKAQKYSHWF